MAELKMKRWLSGDAPKGRTAWSISFVDEQNATFPPDERVAELWKQHVPDGGEVTLPTNYSRGEFLVIVHTPAGIKKKRRRPFLRALQAETIPA